MSIIQSFFKKSSLVILCYSITDRKSFDEIELYLKDAQKFCPPYCKFILVGTQVDVKEEKKINKEEGLKFKKDNNLDYFIEILELTLQNFENILMTDTIIILKNYLLKSVYYRRNEMERKNKEKN